MTYADEVREYCRVNFIDLARARGDKLVTICVGDVHDALNYRNRLPLVCAALGTNLFEESLDLKRVSIEGPLNSTQTVFTFRLL